MDIKKIVIEIIGWIGAIMLLIGYFLIQTERVEYDNKVYIILNILGAFCLMINAWTNSAYPSAITNFLWFLVGSFFAYKVFFPPTPAAAPLL